MFCVTPQSILPGTRQGALMINLFGGPCIGKTGMAANIFLALKTMGIEAANPEEHAKIAVLHRQQHLLDEQLILLGRTWDTLHALADQVDVVVVDSPLLLCSVYAGDKEAPHFHATVRDFHSRFSRINCLLTRNATLSYSTTGRRETLTQSLLMDQKIEQALRDTGEDFIKTPPVGESTQAVAQRIAQAAAQWLDANTQASQKCS